jgi:DNA-directed RNA polymerase specialized sigma24 family protein
MESTNLLSDLKSRKNEAYNLMYKSHYPSIERFVVRNSGTRPDAQDVFQETLIILLNKVPQEDFRLTSSIKAYVQAVASNIWLKRLRDDKRLLELKDDQLLLEDLSLAEWQAREEHRLQRSRVKRMFRKITRHCFIFLTKTFIVGVSREKLIEELGYRNKHTFDNQKYKCLEQARKHYQPEG